MGDGVVVGKDRIEGRRVGGRVLGGFHDPMIAAHDLQHLDHAMAVGAIDQDQGLAVAGHQGTDGCFDDEGAAALKGDANVAVFGAGDREQSLPDARIDFNESGIARAPVAQHGFLGFRCRGQGSRRQEERVGACHGGSF
jgi:hypothetical protein